MNDNDTKVRLKNIELYPDRDTFIGYAGYYIKAVYEVETETQVREIIIPKIDLGLRSDIVPRIDIGPGPKPEAKIHLLHGGELPLCSKAVSCVDKYGETVEAPDVLYVKVVKREKQKKMTVEEIEKNLGYKVEIVSEKGE